MCSTFNPDWRYNISLVSRVGNVYCPKKMRPERHFGLKKTSRLLDWIKSQCPQGAFLCKTPSEEQKKIRFSWRVIKGFTFLISHKNQFKMLLDRSFDLADIASTERSVKVVTLILIARDGLSLWKVWSLAACLQNSFSVTGVSEDKKTRFYFTKKEEFIYPTSKW